jgi:hypothetical protein
LPRRLGNHFSEKKAQQAIGMVRHPLLLSAVAVLTALSGGAQQLATAYNNPLAPNYTETNFGSSIRWATPWALNNHLLFGKSPLCPAGFCRSRLSDRSSTRSGRRGNGPKVEQLW